LYTTGTKDDTDIVESTSLGSVQRSQTDSKDTSKTAILQLEQPFASHGMKSTSARGQQTLCNPRQADKSCPQERSATPSSAQKQQRGDSFHTPCSSSKRILSRKARPKRALTAYNIFFKEQREQILAERRQVDYAHFDDRDCILNNSGRKCPAKQYHKMGFEEMGKTIGQRWKEVDVEMRQSYEARARAEKKRYSEELAEYMLNETNQREAKLESLQASVSEETKRQYFARQK